MNQLSRPRVIVTRPLPGVEPKMVELFDTVLNPEDRALTRDELVAAMQDCDVLVPNVTDRIDAAMIDAAGERLKLIANFGAGLDHLDRSGAQGARASCSPIRPASSPTIPPTSPWR